MLPDMQARHFYRYVTIGAGALTVLAFGCTAGSHPEVSPTMVRMGWTRGADVMLRQPFAPPGQQNLRLVGASAYLATSADRRAALLGFHLPGSTDSPRAFVVYWTGPGGDGDYEVPTGVQGFMIQELGELAGKRAFVGGHVSARAIPMHPRWRRLQFSFDLQGGAELRGEAVAEELPREVQKFERQHAGDVELLKGPTTAPTEDKGAAPATAPAGPQQ